MTSAVSAPRRGKFGVGGAEAYKHPRNNMEGSQRPGHTRSVLILYGSETGNAQEVAEELGTVTERLRFVTHVSELNQVKPVSTIARTYRILRWTDC